MKLLDNYTNTGMGTGSITNSGSCINTTIDLNSNGGYWQWYPYQSSYSGLYIYNQGNVAIRKVSNGYIVSKDGKEIVVTDKTELLNYIE